MRRPHRHALGELSRPVISRLGAEASERSRRWAKRVQRREELADRLRLEREEALVHPDQEAWEDCRCELCAWDEEVEYLRMCEVGLCGAVSLSSECCCQLCADGRETADRAVSLLVGAGARGPSRVVVSPYGEVFLYYLGDDRHVTVSIEGKDEATAVFVTRDRDTPATAVDLVLGSPESVRLRAAELEEFMNGEA